MCVTASILESLGRQGLMTGGWYAALLMQSRCVCGDGGGTPLLFKDCSALSPHVTVCLQALELVYVQTSRAERESVRHEQWREHCCRERERRDNFLEREKVKFPFSRCFSGLQFRCTAILPRRLEIPSGNAESEMEREEKPETLSFSVSDSPPCWRQHCVCPETPCPGQGETSVCLNKTCGHFCLLFKATVTSHHTTISQNHSKQFCEKAFLGRLHVISIGCVYMMTLNVNKQTTQK